MAPERMKGFLKRSMAFMIDSARRRQRKIVIAAVLSTIPEVRNIILPPPSENYDSLSVLFLVAFACRIFLDFYLMS